LSRNIYIHKFDPKAENGLGCFPVQDVRRALEGIGDPFYREWNSEEENGEICIETGVEKTYTGPDGRTHSERCTDSFHFTVKDGRVGGLDWDRPLGREGTIRALWHLIETHGLSLIDPSGGGDHPMLYVPSKTCLEDVEQVWPDCRKTGAHVFDGYEDFRSHFES